MTHAAASKTPTRWFASRVTFGSDGSVPRAVPPFSYSSARPNAEWPISWIAISDACTFVEHVATGPPEPFFRIILQVVERDLILEPLWSLQDETDPEEPPSLADDHVERRWMRGFCDFAVVSRHGAARPPNIVTAARCPDATPGHALAGRGACGGALNDYATGGA
jgi:hypothetical protein